MGLFPLASPVRRIPQDCLSDCRTDDAPNMVVPGLTSGDVPLGAGGSSAESVRRSLFLYRNVRGVADAGAIEEYRS